MRKPHAAAAGAVLASSFVAGSLGQTLIFDYTVEVGGIEVTGDVSNIPDAFVGVVPGDTLSGSFSYEYPQPPPIEPEQYVLESFVLNAPGGVIDPFAYPMAGLSPFDDIQVSDSPMVGGDEIIILSGYRPFALALGERARGQILAIRLAEGDLLSDGLPSSYTLADWTVRHFDAVDDDVVGPGGSWDVIGRRYLFGTVTSITLRQPCVSDLTGDGVTDVFDLLEYLSRWFALDASAELTGDDPPSIDVFDLLAYLDVWFRGC